MDQYSFTNSDKEFELEQANILFAKFFYNFDIKLDETGIQSVYKNGNKFGTWENWGKNRFNLNFLFLYNVQVKIQKILFGKVKVTQKKFIKKVISDIGKLEEYENKQLSLEDRFWIYYDWVLIYGNKEYN